MIFKLPKWIWFGMAVLTFSAGLINAIAYLGFAHQAVSHVTGSFTQVSISFYQLKFEVLLKLVTIIATFFIGAVLSGIIIQDAHFKFGQRYGIALIIESILLIGAAYGFKNHSFWGECIASMACGLQNAMVSTYSGAIVRTTHMTGILTDLGVLVGHWAIGLKVDLRKFFLFLIIIVSFVLGGIFGTISFSKFYEKSMFIPAIITGLFGGFYFFLKRTSKILIN